MMRSLKMRHFATVLVMTVVVVFGARSYAQFTTSRLMRLELHDEMQSTLMTCANVTDSPNARAQCLQKSFQHHLFNHFSGAISTCQNAQPVGAWSDDDACAALAQNQAFWSSPGEGTEPGVQLVVSTLGGQLWHAARLTDHPELRIVMSDKALSAFTQKILNIRDNQLPVFVPMLLLVVAIMAHFLVKVTLGPLENLKVSLKNLKPENFNHTSQITTPYKEFDDFISVYHQLLKRLDNSFTKAKRFSSDAAHEVRTPLAILRGQADSLIADAPTGSTLQVRLRSMADEIERLIVISEKLLLLSKADDQLIEQDLTDVDISEMVEELADSLAQCHPHLAIEKDIQSGLSWRCDLSLIQQLVHNLASNAVKYNTPNGWIRLSLHGHGEVLELGFENTCAELPADLKAKAFHRFYRGDAARNRKVDGAGLGLSICNEIAKLHQGTLTLDVTAQSTVMIRLQAPLHPALKHDNDVMIDASMTLPSSNTKTAIFS